MAIKNNFLSAANEDLFDHPCQRLPVCLCLDVSGSMNIDEKITHLNHGTSMFYKAIQEDEITANSAEISVVTFGEFPPKARCIRDFSRVEIQHQPPQLTASGYTPLGEGVNLSLDLLEKRTALYDKAGISYFRPWLIIMSDGEPEGHDPLELERAKERVKLMVAKKKVLPLPISIGNYDNPDLAAFGDGALLHLREDSFRSFFSWLHKSISASSSGTPGDEIDYRKLLDSAVTWSSDIPKK